MARDAGGVTREAGGLAVAASLEHELENGMVIVMKIRSKDYETSKVTGDHLVMYLVE